MGWMVPPTPDYYASWASKYHFLQNDTLVFNFDEGTHDLTLLLSKEDFDACNMKNPLVQYTKPSRISVTVSDTIYFACSFGEHCANEQKFAAYFASAAMPPGPCPSPTESASAADQCMQSRPFKFV
ncbi:hypothetical protein ACLB2K_074589 [Fragaria x ananassa]